MWIHFNDAFLSIVAHRDRPGHYMVRARVAGDIERVFPQAEATETPAGDYRFRTVLPIPEVVAALAERAASIDYPNFKGSIAPSEGRRHDAYLRCWSALREWQRDMLGRRR